MKKVDQSTFTNFNELPDAKHLIWATGKRELALKTPIFNINKVHRINLDGREGDFVELCCPEWVCVLPPFTGTDGVDYFVMERQYRHGSDRVILEFVSGIAEKGEDPFDAAKRELLEETGLIASDIHYIGHVSANDAFMTNYLNFYLAEGLSVQDKLDKRKLDANEQIDVLCVPCEDVVKAIQEGKIDNFASIVGLYFLNEKCMK